MTQQPLLGACMVLHVFLESLCCEVGFPAGVTYEGGPGVGVGGLDVVFEYTLTLECPATGLTDTGQARVDSRLVFG